MSWTKNVFSSHVQSIGYNDETGELEVTWQNGRVSAYEGVDEGMALSISNAVHPGEELHKSIKGQYSHRYLR